MKLKLRCQSKNQNLVILKIHKAEYLNPYAIPDFRRWLSARMREKLRRELEKVLTPKDDLILIRLSEQCVRDLPKYNRPNTWLLDEKGFRVI